MEGTLGGALATRGGDGFNFVSPSSTFELAACNCTTHLFNCSYFDDCSRICEPAPDDWALVLGMFVTIFVTVVGSAGNILTLCTLAHQFWMPRRRRFIKMMTADTVLITNLAIADLFYSSINLPFVFATYYRLYVNGENSCPWVEDSDACKVSAFLRYMNAISEWMTIGLMALERCVCIYKYRAQRSKSKWFTRNKTVAYCLLIWLFGGLCQLPTLFGKFGEFGYNEEFVKCDFKNEKHSERPRLVFFALESMVPCVLILIGYIVILVQVYSNNSRILSLIVSKGAQLRVDLRRSRTTKVITLLLMVYLVCVIPLCGYNIAVANLTNKRKNLGIVIYCMYWCQYFINNLIYVVSNGRYRNAYRQFLAMVFCRKMPLPPPPAHVANAACRHRAQSVFTISGSDHLKVNDSSRCRTISEFEEKLYSIMTGDYERQDSITSSLSLDGCFWSSRQSSPSMGSLSKLSRNTQSRLSWPLGSEQSLNRGPS